MSGDRSRSVFRPATQETLGYIRDFTASCRPNMILTNAYINAESAQLGYLLSRKVKTAPGDGRHKTFFANCTLEAVSGALKLARHTSVRAGRRDGGRVLVVDPDEGLSGFLNPTGAPPERALAPEITFVTSPQEALELLGRRAWCAVAAIRTAGSGDREAEYVKLMDAAAEQGALRVWCNCELGLEEPDFFSFGPPCDVHVFGENLTDRQVPFGCFTMTEDAYRVWNNPRDSIAHTSTFGGNALCLGMVIRRMRMLGLVSDAEERVLGDVDQSMRARIDHFRDYVNPFVAQGMEMSDFALDIDTAVGSRLTLADGRVVHDCAGGGGVNLRGHNPPDVREEVLAVHDPGHDYFADLESLLCRLTGFPHAFPAVSGATSVDLALSLALLANPGRTTIVTFVGNFSGKTLGSMNLSKYGQQYTESDREAFQPYYFDVVYVDPFAADAVNRLRDVLTTRPVALVWTEFVHGMDCRPVPREILRLVGELKRERGYLVGVDEVMTGGWRAGPGFLAHDGAVPADLVTLAKPLSDTLLPMGAVLASANVVERAVSRHPDRVAALRLHHRFGLGAHIAVHALNRAGGEEATALRAEAQRVLREGLAAIAARSRLFSGVAGQGGHIRLTLSKRWFPYHKRSQFGQLLEAAISALLLEESGVLVMQLRFFHRVDADPAEAAQVVRRLAAGTASYTPLTVYAHAARQVLRYAVAQTARDLRAKIRWQGYWHWIRPHAIRFSRSTAFRRGAPRFLPRLDRTAHRMSGGRVLLGQKLMPSLMLTSVGHRTGRPRRTPLSCLPEADGGFVIAATNFGRDDHPAWSTNLIATPEATVHHSGRSFRVRARLLSLDEKAAVLPSIYEVWPVYQEYVESTPRDVRVFRLTPVASVEKGEPTMPSRRLPMQFSSVEPRDAAEPDIDLTVGRVEHRAIRSDFARLVVLLKEPSARAMPPARAKAVRTYIDRLVFAIVRHHRIEDGGLWPLLTAATSAEIDLSGLSDDHVRLDELLERLQQAAAGFQADPAAGAGPLYDLLSETAELLDRHMSKEEELIFPLLAGRVSQRDYQRFESAARREFSIGDLTFMGPWLAAYATPEERRRALAPSRPYAVMLALGGPGFRRLERRVFGPAR